jgi:microsomal epoxide hydrolase
MSSLSFLSITRLLHRYRIGEKLLTWPQHPLPTSEILKHVTLWWLTETFPTSIYPYRDMLPNGELREDLTSLKGKKFGYSHFIHELAPMPGPWVKMEGDCIFYRRHETVYFLNH